MLGAKGGLSSLARLSCRARRDLYRPSGWLQGLYRPPSLHTCRVLYQQNGHGIGHRRECVYPQPPYFSDRGKRPTSELPKSFDPQAMEQHIYNWWECNEYFAPSAATNLAPFVMTMPPPNVTGKLHMGHAMFVTLQDVLARYHRLRGRPVLWLPGTDHAGIATQMTVEKMLHSEGVTREQLGREAFERRAWEWKASCGGEITRQLRRLGASCDWGRERFTLDPGSCQAVTTAFQMLHERGLVYRGSYMVNWSPGLKTAVSDLEVEYSEEPGVLYVFKYPVVLDEELEQKNGTTTTRHSYNNYVPIATTRPETILGDTALAVHPEDPRYKHLIGKHAVVPFVNRQIPIIADEYVDREFGTGALKITPGHDVNDYEIGQRHNLEIINIMNDDGTLNGNAGPLCGASREEARQKVWQNLVESGLAIETKDHLSRVPHAQRGGEIVEPLVREQWFVRMDSLAQRALQSLNRGELRIIPDRFEKVYRHWLENIRDWCISRQLWWGHRFPVWFVYDSEDAADRGPQPDQPYVVARDEESAAQMAREKYTTHAVIRQESDVLDTWFSSALWPFSTLGWPHTMKNNSDYMRFFPTSVLETGHDILFFWVARMTMLSLELTGQTPFHTAYLHGLVRDEKGRKMSKTLGNVVDPVCVCQEYGADALRFTLATGTSPGQDLNLSLDRVNSARNFTNKLWNAGKFVLHALRNVSDDEWSRLGEPFPFADRATRTHLPLSERWVLDALDRAVHAMTAALERYDFGEAGRVLYEFVWSDFADWYIEAAKTRLYGDVPMQLQEQTRMVLVHIYTSILAMAHPFVPFITEELWGVFPPARLQPALITASWPEHGGFSSDEASNNSETLVHQAASDVSAFEKLQAAVRAVRNSRAEYGVEPGRRIEARFHVSDTRLCAMLQEEAAVIALLAKLDPDKLTFTHMQPSASGQASSTTSIRLVVAEGLEVELPMVGLFDVAKEANRLRKQMEKLEKEVQALESRLERPGFSQRAPHHIVEEVERNLGEAGQQLDNVRAKLLALEGTAAL